MTTILLEGKDVKVINVHLEAFDKPTRDRQTDFIVKLFKETSEKYPTILLGDFNSDPDYENASINKILNLPGIGNAAFSPDAYEDTFDSAKPYERIDYIFYTPKNITYVEGKVLSEFGQASDHLPLLMRFRLK